jgi:hypothetical protein
MTCRDEVLLCAKGIIEENGVNAFTPCEILSRMKTLGTHYQESTIRTHITSRMCANAPKNHAVKYNDLERISPATYSLLKVGE